MGAQAGAFAGEDVPAAQAPGWQELADGRDLLKVKGKWKYLCRAVDKDGNTVDFLLRAHLDKAAARRYFEKAIAHNDAPRIVTIDKSGANQAALKAINTTRECPMEIRQRKYLNIVERITVPSSGEPGP